MNMTTEKKKKNKFLRYGIIIVALLLLVSIIGKKMGFVGGDDKIEVLTEKAQLKTIIETVSASGKVQPEVEVKISPDVSGEVVELLVKEGDKVTKGQVLAKIKPDIYQSMVERSSAAVSTSKANLENAVSRLNQSESQFRKNELSYKRSKKLHDDAAISNADYEAALSLYEVAKADVEAAKKNVEAAKFGVASSQASLKEANDNLIKTTILAPVSGTVSKLNIEAGERVVGTSQMAGTEMMRISNLTSMEVSVDVNENDINRVSLGDSAIIEIDAFRNKKFKGIVTEIGSSANIVGLSTDQVTNFTVKVRILQESYKDIEINNRPPFRPGLSATVDIQTEKVLTCISIPIQGVTTRMDSAGGDMKKSFDKPKTDEDEKQRKASDQEDIVKEYVFVLDQKAGIVKQREVKTGIQDDSYIEIKSGLQKDEEVITAPYIAVSKKLKDGSHVQKVTKEKLFASEK